MKYEFNLINIIIFHSDMVLNQSIDLLLYYSPCCDDTVQKIRKYATLDPHLNYRDTKDKYEKYQSYNGPYKSKSDFYIIYNVVDLMTVEGWYVDIIVVQKSSSWHLRSCNDILIINNAIDPKQRSLRLTFYCLLIKTKLLLQHTILHVTKKYLQVLLILWCHNFLSNTHRRWIVANISQEMIIVAFALKTKNSNNQIQWYMLLLLCIDTIHQMLWSAWLNCIQAPSMHPTFHGVFYQYWFQHHY